jgi:hypothetical protein
VNQKEGVNAAALAQRLEESRKKNESDAVRCARYELANEQHVCFLMHDVTRASNVVRASMILSELVNFSQ